MISVPDDIYPCIAVFLAAHDLNRLCLANKSISSNPLIKKHVFRLRLKTNLNCRPFMPIETAKLQQKQFAESWPPALGSVADLYFRFFKNKESDIPKAYSFSLTHNFIVFRLRIPKCKKGNSEVSTYMARKLYPYTAIDREKIECLSNTMNFAIVQVTYDCVPEKYVTFEQAKHDIECYYDILKSMY